MRKLVKEKGLDKEYEIDSAGLISYHEGEGADPRMKSHAYRHGYHLDGPRLWPGLSHGNVTSDLEYEETTVYTEQHLSARGQ